MGNSVFMASLKDESSNSNRIQGIKILNLKDHFKGKPEKNIISEEQFEKLVSTGRKSDLAVERALSDLTEGYSLLVLLSPETYSEARSAFFRKFSTEKGIYITLNSPYSSLCKELESKSIDHNNVYFIDMSSSGSQGAATEEGKASFLESPSSLTELSMLLDGKISYLGGSLFIILDSVSTLLVYNEPREVERFIHSLAGKANASKTKLILFMMKSNDKSGIVDTISQFCTKVAAIDNLVG